MKKSVKEVIDSDYHDYSMYVLKNRAIPSVVDGFKPVQRKLVYALLDRGGNKTKIAELGGSLSSYGYLHGETSAMSAAVNMSADWDNNAPIFKGYGNFGSRIIQEAAAPRYIYSSISENFKKYFCHEEICEYTNDEDTPEPSYYLPVIPWVLVNGSKGIAVGFATNILPRDPKQLAKVCKKYIEGKKISLSDLKPSFPDFKGVVEHIQGNQYRVSGIAELEKNLQVRISELPIGYDREYYIGVLNKLLDSDKITDYEDCCSENGFEFLVKINRLQKQKIEDNILGYFKLETTFTENITTLDENGNLKIFADPVELVEYFCDFRIKKCERYINYTIDKLKSDLEFNQSRMSFIKDVVDRKIDLRDYSKSDLIADISHRYNVGPSTAEKHSSIPVWSMTQDSIDSLQEKINSIQTNIVAWMNITSEMLYTNLLTDIIDRKKK